VGTAPFSLTAVANQVIPQSDVATLSDQPTQRLFAILLSRPPLFTMQEVLPADTPLFSTFPMFVPSLSWQTFDF
jgi:hypothetical protein